MPKEKRKDITTTYRLPFELQQNFKAACVRKGITMTEVIVKAMEQTIKSK